LFDGLSGRILEAGVGTGRNFRFYPPHAEIYAIDQSRGMLDRAQRRAASAKRRVQLEEMSVEALKFSNRFFDAAVASFLMCTMPSEARQEALRELRRVLKPSGKLRLLEYGPAQSRIQRTAARIWQPWATWAFGARLAEDVENDVRASGFAMKQCRYVTGSIMYIEAEPR
jgi:ubiquinone/menaquinone biosynthesis C-methylase UbiE